MLRSLGSFFRLLSLVSVALALPQGRGITVSPSGSDSLALTLLGDFPVVAQRQAIPAPAPLRILALGASVTFGIGSSTGDSYRKDLRDQLVTVGQTVNYVGEFESGNFTNRQVEATPGFVIRQIAGLATAAVPRFLPNLVLLDAGTNNCNAGAAVPDAGANVSSLVASIYAQSPNSAVILATLLVNQDPAQDTCRVDVNRQYTALASQLMAQGARFVLVDMRSPDGPTTADLFDTRHPNDVGYQKMAKVWMQGIQQALSRGFITAPADNGIPADGTSQL